MQNMKRDGGVTKKSERTEFGCKHQNEKRLLRQKIEMEERGRQTQREIEREKLEHAK